MKINGLQSNSDNQQMFGNVEQVTEVSNAPEKTGRNIYGGDINEKLGLDGRIEEKKNNAQQQAMRIISEACEKDAKMAENIEKLKELQEKKAAESIEAKNKVAEYDVKKEELRQQYGVEKDSKEQQDVELLQKYQNSKEGISAESFSEDEINRLKELQNTSLTEYQTRVLELNRAQGAAKEIADIAEREAIAATQGLTDTKIEQLKSQDMLKAQDSADKIIDNASEEVVSMIVQDAKDNIDDKAEEEKKKAEELGEKNKEQKERLEEKREQRKEQEELLSKVSEGNKMQQNVADMHNVSDNVKKAHKNINRIIRENSLINEDIKGIEINFDF